MPGDLPDPTVKLFIGNLDSERSQKRLLEVLSKVKCLISGSVRIWIQLGSRYVCTGSSGEEAARTKGVSISSDIDSIVRNTIASGQTQIGGPASNPRFVRVGGKPAAYPPLVYCIPMKDRDGETFGTVQILAHRESEDSLAPDSRCLELLEGLIDIGAIAISATVDLSKIPRENQSLTAAGNNHQSAPILVGKSEAFLKARIDAEIYATCDYPVMITGESGTGKELMAREIHMLSSRRENPFLIQNCSAIPDGLLESELFGYRKGAFTGANENKIGLFEAASGGTLFLDEIGDMPLGLQAKILRVLQSHEIKPLGTTQTHKVDVRVIASTNRDLTTALAKAEFRKDLYYRLNVLPLQMPPVRERKEDIPLLFNHFLDYFAHVSGKPPKILASDTMALLVNYAWPGNIREIENLVKYFMTVMHGDTIRHRDLPPPYRKVRGAADFRFPVPGKKTSERPFPGGDYGQTGGYSMRDMERTYLLSLLEMTRWNVTSAAELAGMKRTTFSYRMKRLGIRRTHGMEAKGTDDP